MTGLGRLLAASVLVFSAVLGPAGPTLADSTPTPCSGAIGNRLPVLLVHGFNSSAATWRPEVRARFCTSRTYVDTFDYGPESNEWVTDPGIGPALAGKILALANASTRGRGDGKVMVVAHSMGGLAVRCAVNPSCNGGVHVVPSHVAGVVTFDTPNEGSFWRGKGGALAAGGLGGIVSGSCYGDAIINLGQKDATAGLCKEVRVLATSHASRGFTPGSAALKALPGSASGFPILAVAGHAQVRTGIFFAGLNLGPGGDAGDLIVSPTSATAVSRTIDGMGGKAAVDCGSLSIGARLGSSVPKFDVSHLLCSHLNETSYGPFLDQASRMVNQWLARHPARPAPEPSPSPTPTPTPTPSPSPNPTPPASTPTAAFARGSHFDAYCAVAWPTAPEYTSTAVVMRMSCSGVPSSTYLFTDVQLDDPSFTITPSTGRVHVVGTVADSTISGLGFHTLQVLATSIQK